MDLMLGSEQTQVVEALRAVLEQEFPVERFRRASRQNTDDVASKWPLLIEMGWFGLGLPESCGGTGFGAAEEMLMYVELGRHLVSPSVLATTLGAHLAVDDPELLGSILGGEKRVGLALPAALETTIGTVVDGDLLLFDADGADLLLAWDVGFATLVDGGQVRGRSRLPGFDESIGLQRAAAADLVPVVAPARGSAVDTRGTILVAAMLAGIAAATSESAVEYAKIREQFGQVIGGFQAVKHKCARMAVRAESSYAQVVFSALTLAEDRPDSVYQASAAKIVAAGAALQNARDNIQIHGGIGFTAESDAHRFLKRAHLYERFGGAVRAQQARLLREPAPIAAQESGMGREVEKAI